MSVDADHAAEFRANVGDDSADFGCRRSAVGIAEAKHIGSGLVRGFKSAQREIAIVNVAVEEMFGVVDDFAAMLLQVRDGFGNQREILIFADAERAMHMQIPALSEDGYDGGFGVQKLANVAILFDWVLREARGAESH